jgi:predicted CoA-binding protein
MNPQNPVQTNPLETQAIAHIVAQPRTVAVVGLSPKVHRASFEVSSYMQAQGWRIVPINPNATEILGEKAYPTLTDAALHVRIDVVNVFRNSEDVPPVVDEAIAIGAKAVWMQMGIAHTPAANKAMAAGLQVVQNKCLMVEHRRHASR